MTSGTTNGNAEAKPAIDMQKLAEVNQLVIRTLGEAVSLMAPMSKYQQTTIADIKARVLPPIVLQQARVFRHKGFPVAFVSWAMVSEEVEQRLLQNPGDVPKANEWRSGRKLFFVDIASPKGNEEQIKAAVQKRLAEASSEKGGAPALG